MPNHDFHGEFCQWDSNGFAHEWDRTGSPGVHFQYKHFISLNGKLHVHETDHLKLTGQCHGLGANPIDQPRRQRVWGEGAGGISRMNAGFFHVFHDAGHDDVGPVRNRIHVNLNGIG